MNKNVKVFCFGILLLLQCTIVGKNTYPKGEAVNTTASPLFMLQEKDSILKLRYLKIQKLYNDKDYSASLADGLVLLDEVESSGNKELQYLCNFLIGDVFRKINNHNKALTYFKKALTIIQKRDKLLDNNLKLYDGALSRKGYLAKTLLKIGVEFYRLEQQDSSSYYYNEIIKLPILNNDISDFKASAYNNLSGAYMLDSIYDLAEIYALEAVKMHQQRNDVENEAAALGNLANIHLRQKDYSKAKEIYSKAINLIEFNKSTSAIKFKEDLYYNLAWTLYLLKDYKAYDFQELSYNIKDELRDVEIRKIVEEIYSKHEVEFERQKANLAKNRLELKKLNDRKITLFYGALSLLVIIISGVVMFNYRLRQRNLKLLIVQNELAQQSNLEKLKSESQIRILNATLDGKESERKQIAETLHDSVSTLLSSASMHLQASRTQFNGDTPLEINKSQKIITEASQKIRDLSHTLVSSVLLKFGLRFAINDMAEKYSNSQIELHSKTSNLRRYKQSFEIKVNNIIEEFVNNVLKHSNASNAMIIVREEDNKLHININDDGDGFDKKLITKKDGMGINQIEARIHMMKGSFEIDTKIGRGTKIKVVLPVIEKTVTKSV